MQLPVRTLLANLELIRALHPEARSNCILVETWLELHTKGRLDAEFLLDSHWIKQLSSLSKLATGKLFGKIPVEARPPEAAGGFGFFEESSPFALTDGSRSIPLSKIAALHPCLDMISTQTEDQSDAYYLIEGSYWSGWGLPKGVHDFRETLLIVVSEKGENPYVIPLRSAHLRLTQEVASAVAS